MGIYIFVSVLVLIACVFQILIVLVQNSKGGGLAANFTSAGQTMGIRKTADFLEKATWTLAASILVLSLVATATIPGKTREANLRTSIDAAVDASQIPTLPTAVPPASQTTSTEGEQDNN
ncbi:MAG: preprotein translocase subunit SecG [Methanosarcina sp.]|nr:preprotein translocase subunit SecG [Methanosarcina sp.]